MGNKSDTSSYITVAGEASAELVVEKSRFIAYVSPAPSKDAAEAFIASVREKHRDATHNVPAYVIGSSQDVMWSSEDGEPQGTAGAPVLKMMVQEGLTDVCMVITRYFGGIKLGTGGLVRAYTQVAKMALESAGKALIKDMVSLRMRCDYKPFNKISKFDFDGKARVANVTYTDAVEFDVVTDPADEERVTALISDISGGTSVLLEKMIIQDKIMC